MSKHLTLSDRAIIEKYIALDVPFAYIARQLGRSPSTISREVKKHRTFTSYGGRSIDHCMRYHNCAKRNLCGAESADSCIAKCKTCKIYDCKDVCDSYTSSLCPSLERAPYVCTNCRKQSNCIFPHAYYSSSKAHTEYLKELSNSRKGIQISQEKLYELNELLSPLVQKGQSINHIFANHKDEIGLSQKTIYNYIDARVFDVRNIDLPRKVRYRRRKTPAPIYKIEYQYRRGRTYSDFNTYIENHPNVSIVEMDTVKGSRNAGKVLLTLLFRDANFMLIFLMLDGTQESVIKVFDYLTDLLGIEAFKKLFTVILTDNGSEFKDAFQLEHAKSGAKRTHLFYCDPQASWQKGRIEKNHILIRQILPKKLSFESLTPEDVHLITCHINSVVREIFENKTPFELMASKEQKKLLNALELHQIPPDEVLLRPTLLKKK